MNLYLQDLIETIRNPGRCGVEDAKGVACQVEGLAEEISQAAFERGLLISLRG